MALSKTCVGALYAPKKIHKKNPIYETLYIPFKKIFNFFFVKKYRSLHIVPRTTIWYEASMDSLAQVSVGGLAQVAVRLSRFGRTFV